MELKETQWASTHMFSLNPKMLSEDNMAMWPQLLRTAALVQKDRGGTAEKAL